MKKAGLLFIFTYIILPVCFSGDIYFRHLNTKDGLSSPGITSFYQDELGFIWIGTRDGLNYYDGSQIKNFQAIKEKNINLSGVPIRFVCGNKKGSVFILHHKLLSYDLRSGRFTLLDSLNIHAVSYGYFGLLGISGNQIYRYNEAQKKRSEWFSFKETEILPTSIIQSDTKKILIGTQENGLYIIDQDKTYKHLFPNENITCLFEDSKGFIWIGTRTHGVIQFDISGKIIRNIRYEKNESIYLSSDNIRCIIEDRNGHFWIGTQFGLDLLNFDQHTSIHFKYDRNNLLGISNSSIRALLCDNGGNIWIGSYYGSIDYFNPQSAFYQFEKYNHFPTNIFNEMLEDKQNNLWITNGGGGSLIHYNRKNNSSIIYRELSSKHIKTILLDEERNTLWIGTLRNGLYRMSLINKQFKFYKNNDQIRRIVQLGDSLFLATSNAISLMDVKHEKISELFERTGILHNKYINDLAADSNSNLWFCTDNNLFKYNIHSKKLTQIIDCQTILSNLYLDKQGTVWCGTSNKGLLKVNGIDSIQFFSPENSSINSYNIIDIKENKTGNLIVATSQGISWMDKKNQTFRNIAYNRFVPLLQVNEDGLLVTSDGNIFLGGINGLFEFKEEDVLNEEKKVSPIIFTDLYVNNQPISPSDPEGIISNNLAYEKNIRLKHYHASFSILFSVPDYTFTEHHFEYILKGFDKDWISISGEKKITYSNLPPGKYTLMVRDRLTNNSQEIGITMFAPFYKTTVAYIAYSILILGILFLILSNYISRIHLQASLNYSKKEKEQIETLNQIKLRFFTNVSHEFRTPLTLIIGHIEMLMQNIQHQQNLYFSLTKILSNARRIQRLISELIEFNKQEQGFLKLNVCEQDLILFLEEIINSFQEYALSKNIDLNFHPDLKQLTLWFDAGQMEKVFFNLISNAFKHTPSGGNISINLSHNSDKVFVDVCDTGNGIPQDATDKIFDRFYQVEKKKTEDSSGFGIGLSLVKNIVHVHHGNISVKSEEGKGSVFTIGLQRGNNHFKPEELNQTHPESILPTLNLPDTNFVKKVIEEQKDNNTFQSSILIIEDNLDLLEMLAKLFEPFYKVMKANNGKEGLEKTKEIQPDIILSDIFMPEMSGIEMCKQLKENPETCHIPVILLTAQHASEYIIEGLEQGADDYIIKPFDTKVLITRCINLVNNRKKLQKYFLSDLTNNSVKIALNAHDKRLLDNTIRLIEENYGNPHLDVNFLARELAMSKSSLYTKLKGITGESINDFIQNIKIKKSASELLHHPELTIVEIALKFGFNYPSYYIKCFKDTFGETPTQYRKNKFSAIRDKN